MSTTRINPEGNKEPFYDQLQIISRSHCFSALVEMPKKFNTSRKFKSLQFSCAFPNHWVFTVQSSLLQLSFLLLKRSHTASRSVRIIPRASPCHSEMLCFIFGLMSVWSPCFLSAALFPFAAAAASSLSFSPPWPPCTSRRGAPGSPSAFSSFSLSLEWARWIWSLQF